MRTLFAALILILSACAPASGVLTTPGGEECGGDKPYIPPGEVRPTDQPPVEDTDPPTQAAECRVTAKSGPQTHGAMVDVLDTLTFDSLSAGNPSSWKGDRFTATIDVKTLGDCTFSRVTGVSATYTVLGIDEDTVLTPVQSVAARASIQVLKRENGYGEVLITTPNVLGSPGQAYPDVYGIWYGTAGISASSSVGTMSEIDIEPYTLYQFSVTLIGVRDLPHDRPTIFEIGLWFESQLADTEEWIPMEPTWFTYPVVVVE